MSINVNSLFTLLEGQIGRDALASAMLSYLAPASGVASKTPVKAALESASEAPSAPVKAKRAKKEKDPDAPKRAPTEWLLFSGRVRSVIGAESGAKVPGKVWTQVASSLKEAGLMGSATDEQIVAAYKTYLAAPPEHSKAYVAGLTKAAKKAKTAESSSTTSSESVARVLFPEAVAAALSEAEAKPKKVGRKKLVDMTPEERAAHDAKRLAKKAAKAPLPASPKPEDVMDFEPFIWKKLNLLKNSRGDVLTEDMEWFGRFVDGKMDVDVPQPSDLQF
jgi:hypothetical protein